jgi:transposase-like protein
MDLLQPLNQKKMDRKYYDQKIKDEAVQRYINGESSGKLAKELGIHSPDLIRKWAQLWRKKYGVSVENYRKPNIADKVDEIQRLRNIIVRIEEERELVLKTLSLVMKGEIKGWDELLLRLGPK